MMMGEIYKIYIKKRCKSFVCVRYVRLVDRYFVGGWYI